MKVHSEIDFVCLSVRPSVCTMIFKRIAGLHFYPKFLMLYINGFISRGQQRNGKLFQISNLFLIFGWIQKLFQKKSEAWILIKLQCVIYQWICLNELFKIMETFFSISFSNYWPKTEKYSNCIEIDWSANGFDSTVTSSINKWKAFFKFRNHFSN